MWIRKITANSDLSSEIFLNSGGISFSVTSYPDLTKAGRFTGVFVCSARVLYEKLDFGFEILEEILNRSVLDDEKRLNEILSEGKSKSQMKLTGSGHTAQSREPHPTSLTPPTITI